MMVELTLALSCLLAILVDHSLTVRADAASKSGQRRPDCPAVHWAPCCYRGTGLSRELLELRKTTNSLKTLVEKLLGHHKRQEDKNIYPVTDIDGARWRPFWWFKAGSAWPGNVTDVLQDEYGSCDPGAAYCFGRLPAILKENLSEMLGKDSAGTIYRWQFKSSNNVAHATWRALHDRVTVRLVGGNSWMPKVVKGTVPKKAQDSVQYRMEHGVMSFMIDDDGCDCLTSLSMGHGMCLTTFHTKYGVEYSYGADLLYDPGCHSPSNKNGLTLYFRDDDDCTNVTCPKGKTCRDEIYSHVCE